MRYVMAINTTKCIGCHSCSVACKSNNNLPNTKWYNRVQTDGADGMDTVRGTYPDDLHMSFIPIACQHCDNPACKSVCPVEAINQREDGIITQDAEICIGCQLCLEACPYSARTFNEGQLEYVVDFPLGDWDAPAHVPITAEKCTFCAHRIDRGDKPACMEFCPASARVWGDIDDPNSEVSKYIEGKTTYKYLEEEGTLPSTVYVR
jgi:molybdopterin-containing oxidoreductase family iron-sulfur binding subunit